MRHPIQRKRDLSARIRTGRTLAGRKRPLESTLFDRINGLVRAYGLGDPFLALLADSCQDELPEAAPAGRARSKEHFDPPIFSLSGETEYRVTKAILSMADVPYLPFASSPGEILLCRLLYRSNPRLHPDMLARHHFETLLHAEMARREILDLTKQTETLRGNGEDGERLSALEKRIERLHRFVAESETAGSGRG